MSNSFTEHFVAEFQESWRRMGLSTANAMALHSGWMLDSLKHIGETYVLPQHDRLLTELDNWIKDTLPDKASPEFIAAGEQALVNQGEQATVYCKIARDFFYHKTHRSDEFLPHREANVDAYIDSSMRKLDDLLASQLRYIREGCAKCLYHSKHAKYSPYREARSEKSYNIMLFTSLQTLKFANLVQYALLKNTLIHQDEIPPAGESLAGAYLQIESQEYDTIFQLICASWGKTLIVERKLFGASLA